MAVSPLATGESNAYLNPARQWNMIRPIRGSFREISDVMIHCLQSIGTWGKADHRTRMEKDRCQDQRPDL